MACVEAEVSRMAACDEHVPIVDASELSPSQFLERYVKPNLPVLITGLTDGWRARREWVVHGSGAPDVGGAMAEHFGDAEVLVVDCDAPLDTDLARVQMPFREFARFWTSRRGRKSDEGGGGGGNNNNDDDDDEDKNADDDGRRLYLKDWTFTCDFPGYGAYTTPPHFADDWLNAYWDEQMTSREKKNTHRGGGTHRFVYVGLKGTWTPLHADVLRSFSWSVNVAGSKRWLMVPPQRSRHLLSRDGTRRPKDLRQAMRADPVWRARTRPRSQRVLLRIL